MQKLAIVFLLSYLLILSYSDVTPTTTTTTSTTNNTPVPTPTPAGGFDNNLQNLILNSLNTRRNQIAGGQYNQPKASKMYALQWSVELAASAQAWANTVPSARNPKRNFQGALSGENVYTSYSSQITQFDPTLAVESWFDELKDFRSENVDNLKINDKIDVFADYTQLVWGETYLVGCGYKIADHFGIKQTIVVCDFAPGGNIFNQPVYVASTAIQSPANQCQQKNAIYTNLCNFVPAVKTTTTTTNTGTTTTGSTTTTGTGKMLHKSLRHENKNKD